jgi:hypothetical protein
MAEPELSVLTRQALGDYLGSLSAVTGRATAWATERNANQVGIDWQLTTEERRDGNQNGHYRLAYICGSIALRNRSVFL